MFLTLAALIVGFCSAVAAWAIFALSWLTGWLVLATALVVTPVLFQLVSWTARRARRTDAPAQPSTPSP